MFIYQLTIDRKYHSFVFSLLPVALFLCPLCVVCLGSERGLAVCLLGSGLAPSSSFFFVFFFIALYSSLSCSRVSLIVVDDDDDGCRRGILALSLPAGVILVLPGVHVVEVVVVVAAAAAGPPEYSVARSRSPPARGADGVCPCWGVRGILGIILHDSACPSLTCSCRLAASAGLALSSESFFFFLELDPLDMSG